MSQITWLDKIGLIPKTSRVNQWWDTDSNETKAAINDNDSRVTVLEDDVAGSANLIRFDKRYGRWAYKPNTPLSTNTISLDLTDSIDAGVCSLYYKGNVLDKSKILGGIIVSFEGVNVLNELCFIWIIFDKLNNVFHVNIQTGFTGDLPSGIIETSPVLQITDGSVVETSPVLNIV